MNVCLNTGWKLGGILDECIPGYKMETRRNTRYKYTWIQDGI